MERGVVGDASKPPRTFRGGRALLSAAVNSTAEAAYATDANRRIVAFNRAAGRLLGYRRAQVVGRPCYEVLRGTDRFGNRFCDVACPLVNMAERREPIGDFEISVRDSAGHAVHVNAAIIIWSGKTREDRVIVHHLKPIESEVGVGSRASRSSPPVLCEPPHPHLTARQLEVMRQLAAGRSTDEIALALHVSQATVRNHVKATLAKLGVHSRIAALAFARTNRLI